VSAVDLTEEVEQEAPLRPVARPQAARRGPARTIAASLLRAVLVVWAAYTLAFLLLFVLPGDAVLARIGAADAVGASDLSAADLSALRGQLGLESSLLVQYGRGLLGLVTGDLGNSLVNGRPVTELIGEGLPGTAALAGFSLLLSVVLGLLLAILAVAPRSRAIRSLAAIVPSVYVSLPVFWVGILLIYVFALQLRWVPSSGSEGLGSLLLPGAVIGMLGAAQFAQVLISSLRTEMGTTYATVTAPSKGASRVYTVIRHCLRNAALPFLTVLGLRIASLLGGTVVVETVFSRSGLGRLIVESVRSVDLTVVLGIVALLAVVYVVVNLLIDVAYTLIDPRLRRPATTPTDTGSGHDH
jgi:peptide/nickel transport system permease protein